MSNGLRKHPSVGFIAVCITYILVAAFFFWGFKTPDLDRVWTLHHLLKIGEMEKLGGEDKAILDSTMKRHEQLTEALLGGGDIGIISAHMDGWISTPTATLLRTTDSKDYPTININVQTPEDLLPLELHVNSNSWNKQLEVKNHGEFKVDLPPLSGHPEIIEVVLKGRKFEADQSLLGVRLSFEESR